MRDIAGDAFDEVLLRMPASSSQALSSRDDRERQYREFWPAVRGLLRTRYGGLDDHEELYQEAWTELLEYEASGQEIRDTRALLKTIAERRARDRLRNYRPTVVDPDSATFTQTPDAAALPDEQVQVRLDAGTIRQVIETLDEREAAALKLRYDFLLDGDEISRRLGVSPRRLEKVMTAAYRQIADALAVEADGQSHWSRRQRSLLMACETGLASPRQRRQAERMLATDPQCRATLAELRVALRDVAAVLPFPAALREERSRRVVEVLADGVDRVIPGGQRAGRQLVEGVAPTGAAEPVVAGATAITAGGFAKVALACLAAGGTAAACLSTLAPEKGEGPSTAPARTQAAPPPVREARQASLLAPRVTTTQHKKATTKPTVRTKRARVTTPRPQPVVEVPVSSPASAPAPSPAPAGSTEFGPGALGSAQAPTQPAAAPSNGGGEFTP